MQMVTKRLNLYRNGDPSFRPISYLYNNQKVRTFEKLLDEFDERCPPLRGGAVKNLYSVDGKEKIQSIDQIIGSDENELSIVVAGNEPYRPIKNGYESIGSKNQKNQTASNQDESKRTKGGQKRRPKDQRIENRSDPNQMKRITILRNGDPNFQPKMFILRKKQTPTMEKLLEALQRLAPPQEGGALQFLFTTEGQEIENLDDIENGQEYVAAGQGGYQEPGKGFLAANPNSGRRSSKSSGSRSPRSPRLSTPIFTRSDQVQTQSIFIFVFKNGAGLEAGRFIFTPKQLNRGMPWILEQIAKRWGVYPKRLATMDGGQVSHLGALVNKGAYILVPLGENYRDTWYYLPSGAKDTSADSEDMQNRNQNQGDGQTTEKKFRSKKIQRRHSDASDLRSRRDSSASYDSRTESRQNSTEGEEEEEEDEDERNSYSDDYNSSDYDEDSYKRSVSRVSTVSQVSRPSRADTMTLDGHQDEDTHGHRRHSETLSNGLRSPKGRHSHLGITRSGSTLSNCSYCTMLEKHLEKHHGHTHASPRLDDGQSHRERSRASHRTTDSDEKRKKSVKSNVRSISPSPTRAQHKIHNHKRGSSLNSKITNGNKRLAPHKGNNTSSNRLTVSENHGNRKQPKQLQRSSSDGSVFYANNSRRKSTTAVGMKTTSDYSNRSGGNVFHAKNSRSETYGARAVKDSRRTKTEIPVDHRKPRVISEERVPAKRNNQAKKLWR